jgi:hypothetical protein
MNCADPNRGVSLPGVCAMVTLMAMSATVSAQTLSTAQTDPVALVRAAVANEVAAANDTAIKFMFRSRKQTPKGLQNKIYVEANEALAAMVVGQNDHPLEPGEEHAEADELAALANHPDQLRKKQARDQQEVEHTLCILKALPDAFRFAYVGTEDSASDLGKAGDKLVRLKFTPNPSYSPPTRVEQVLQGMEGYLLIDPKPQRLAIVDGTLFKDVTFGWGIFGRLDKGGHFRVQKADVGDGFWEITAMTLNFNGKILLIKNLSIVSEEVFSDFQRLPDDVPFAQGVELLKSQRVSMAHNNLSMEPSEAKRDSGTKW